MLRRPFFIGLLLFLAALFFDFLLIANGNSMLGIFSLLGTIQIFASSTIWFIYRGEDKVKVQNFWLVFPIIIFGLCFYTLITEAQGVFSESHEQMAEVGSLLMFRYQNGLWLMSVVMLLTFLIAGSIMARRGQE